jgi:hypothetical protein
MDVHKPNALKKAALWFTPLACVARAGNVRPVDISTDTAELQSRTNDAPESFAGDHTGGYGEAVALKRRGRPFLPDVSDDSAVSRVRRRVTQPK